MMLAVVAKMAPLAHRFEIRVVAVLGRVIEVRDREDDFALGPDRRLAVAFFASALAMQPALAGAFAATIGADLPYMEAQSLPVGRVATPILCTDRAHEAPRRRIPLSRKLCPRAVTPGIANHLKTCDLTRNLVRVKTRSYA